ncbi:Arginine decarboxylase / Lysine decarboxylase [Staphylococcus aureus]|uniref:Arginine decarboxylase / Lysine decarboxylase n=1 Tax=Staphylococcus aureus TaxID=1280 RepID=A0A380DJ73_STAAU|nr:Arginine decarboxylase / Lysine decarboxylase [Staphylococcus aureus]
MNNDGHKLAVLTYPNYYGETFNVEEVIKSLHQLNIPVLIDEAHGAHFGLQGFPDSTLNYQADYVVQSFHKTLPALTMGSVLYIHKNAPYRENIIEYLSYFQTSSPSYLIMASLESAAQFYKTYDSTVFFDKRAQLIECLEKKGLKCFKLMIR